MNNNNVRKAFEIDIIKYFVKLISFAYFNWRASTTVKNDDDLFIGFSGDKVPLLSRPRAQPWLKLQGFSILRLFPTSVHSRRRIQPSPTQHHFADIRSIALSPQVTVLEWQRPGRFHGVARSIRWRMLLLYRNGCRSLVSLTRRWRYREWMLEREDLWL